VNDEYNDVIEKLNKHFNPMKHVDFHIYQFGEMKQGENESMADFVVKLRKAAVLCEFNASADAEIKRQIIRGCKSKNLKEKILEKTTINLKEILELAITNETIKAQASRIQDGESRSELAAVYQQKHKSNFNEKPIRNNCNNKSASVRGQDRTNTSSKKCFNCGNDYPHRDKCPAIGKECNKCKKLGHYGKCCKNSDKKRALKTITHERTPIEEAYVRRGNLFNIDNQEKESQLPLYM